MMCQHFRLLVSLVYQCINKIEIKIKYIEDLKIQQANKSIFLKLCMLNSKTLSISLAIAKLL